MAKIKLGPMVGQASGAIGASVFSHNRYGAYVRNRTIPVTSTTEFATNAKAVMSAMSQAWQGRTAAQRAQWESWAANNPITDRLGDQRILSGIAAYCMLNARLAHTAHAPIASPPVTPAPLGLATLSVVADVNGPSVSLTFTATPTAANVHLYMWGCMIDSPGIVYVENRLRQFAISGAAQASAYETAATFEARFGALIEDYTVHLLVSTFNDLTGLVSAPLRTSIVVVDTTP